MVTPATAPCAPSSARAMWAEDSQSTSWPGATSDRTASRLASDPVGVKSAASCPNSAATRSCSALTVGSSPYTSSPTSAAAIAARIASVGRVTVSLRRSIGVGHEPHQTTRPLASCSMTSIDEIAWPVTTERLSFRPSTPDDAAAFHAYRHLPEVSEWLPRLSPDAAGVAERFADEEFRSRTFVIEVDGRVVGDLYLHLSDSWAQAEARDPEPPRQAEIGWALDPAYQGRGLALEAVSALVGLCFGELGLRRVFATCFADNTGVVAADGEARHAPRGAHGQGRAAPRPRLGGRVHLRPAGR